MFKYIALTVNYAVALLYLCQTCNCWVLLSPIFHTLILRTPSQCYSNHCQPGEHGQWKVCGECGLAQWVRMKHCYRCQVCVHKFDHHCIFLDLCIGEFNHKYFVAFLWFHLLSALLQATTYLGQLGELVLMDEQGYEHLCPRYYSSALLIIYFFFTIIVVLYLAFYHTWLISHNQTTYERKKRTKIPYFAGHSCLREHPFSQGLFANWAQVLGANSERPIHWQTLLTSHQ